MKELVSIMGGCGFGKKTGLSTLAKRTDFSQFLLLGGCGGLERKLIFHSFYFGRVC